MKSYAQNFEDVLLWRALREVSNGFYIDLGAQHPVVDSVSRWFYEQGWRGVQVEPVPFYADLLRRDRPDDDVIEAVVSDERGDHIVYVFPDTGLSTMSVEIAETHKAELGREWQEQVVSSVTLFDLFARHANREVHWLKVDVEGHERAALSSWGDSPVRPWLILVEATYPNTQIETHAEWESLLTSRGYTFVYADGLNRYYLHEEHENLRKRFRYPPNYFDHFSLGEHWATQELRIYNQQAVEEAENRRRQAEEEKAKAFMHSEERDDRVANAITERVNAHMVELATRIGSRQDMMETRLLTQLREIQGAGESIQADLKKSREDLEGINELTGRMLSRVDDESRRRDEQLDFISGQLGAVTHFLQEARHTPWNALRTLIRRWKGGLLAGGEMSTSNAAAGKSPFLDKAIMKSFRGSHDLNGDTPAQALTLSELYALPPTDFVKISYQAMLDREADPEGLAHYVNRMALGESRLSIHRRFRKSKEFRARNACEDLLALDDEAFVDGAYRRILGRAIDADGRTHYLEKLRDGKSRASVLKSLARSSEARLSLQPSLRLRREIEASVSNCWNAFGLGSSARRLAQLDYTLSTAIQKVETDIQNRLNDLRSETGRDECGLMPFSGARAANSGSIRARWVPRGLRAKAAFMAEAHDDVAPIHADFQDLSRRMRREAAFGHLRNGREGLRFNDYIEADYEPENHNGDLVRWIRDEAALYLHVTSPTFNVEAGGFFEERSVLVSFEDVVVGTLRFGKERSIACLSVSEWVGKDVAIRLKSSGVFNPSVKGLSSDRRDLGLLIRAIYFD